MNLVDSVSLSKNLQVYISKNNFVQTSDFDKNLHNSLNSTVEGNICEASENICFRQSSNIEKLLFEMDLRTSFSPDSDVNPVQTPLNLVGLQDFCIAMAEKNNNFSAEYLDELIRNYLGAYENTYHTFFFDTDQFIHFTGCRDHLFGCLHYILPFCP